MQWTSADACVQYDYKCSKMVWPDVYRGLCIIAVVLIHCTGHVLSRLSMCGWCWYGLAALNRSLQFAVPAFLFVSAFVNTRSLDSKSNTGIGDFWARRLRGWLPPYLLATAVAIMVTRHGDLADLTLRHVVKVLILGKAYYHLYFMVLILQLYLAVPLVSILMPRPIRLTHVIGGGVAMQAGIYAFNRWVWYNPEIGSTLGWYVLPVLLGVWLHRSTDGTAASLARRRSGLTATAVIGAAVFLPIGTLALAWPVDAGVCQWAEWAYSTAMCLLLAVGASASVRGSSMSTRLASIGRRSLIVYLAHPLVIVVLDHACPGLRGMSAAIALPIYASSAIAVPLAMSVVGDGVCRRFRALRVATAQAGKAPPPSLPARPPASTRERSTERRRRFRWC